MTGARKRESLHAAFVLHHRPWRDTSRILEVFTRDHGRLTLFARGVRGTRAPLASILLPFQPLLVAWSGRGDAGQLTRAEAVAAPMLPPAAVMPAYYLNELVLRLTARHDPLPALFDAYAESMEALRCGAEPARPLRLFEKRLLDLLGYGIDLLHEARSGEPVRPGRQYHFSPSEGLRVLDCATGAKQEPGLAGSSLLELHAGTLADPRSLDDARRLLRAALAPLLEGRELATRAVARSVSSRRRPPRPAGQ